MKMLILGGFLGAGKTTALLRLAHYVVANVSSDKEIKLVILENEVGEVGVDDAYLRSGGFEVNNLFSGCACCSLGNELVSSVRKIEEEFGPEWIIVETTGVAYPRRIQENLLGALGIDTRIVIIVDASRWSRVKVPLHALIEGQIQGADAVLINKTDLVDDKTLEDVKTDILNIEPSAAIYTISALTGVTDDIWEQATGGVI